MIDNFSFVIDGRLAVSADPGREPDLAAAMEWLHSQGVRGVVSLTSMPLPAPLIGEYGLTSLHLPIPDFHPPTMDQAAEAVRFIQSIIEGGAAALAHCGSGYGRSGTIAACYLVSTGAEPDAAIRAIRTKRPGSIETFEQEEAVFEFARRMSEGG